MLSKLVDTAVRNLILVIFMEMKSHHKVVQKRIVLVSLGTHSVFLLPRACMVGMS